ncbi:MAG: LLM class flavin-dependent oxidoreductase [Halioglobus sp.]
MTLEVGLTAWTSRQGWRAAALRDQAAWAEAEGFHSLWVPENHFTDSRAVPSPMLLLAAAAAGGERIKLGTTSVLLPIRNPILAAEEVAVLDHLSNGRLILGVGRGLGEDLFRAFGFPQKEKRQRFQKNLEEMLAALRGEPLIEETSGRPSPGLAPLPYKSRIPLFGWPRLVPWL